MNENFFSERVLATEQGLVESEAMAMARKENMGKKEIISKRRATAEDDFDIYLQNEFVEKDVLTDSDTQNIAVGELDERMSSLAEKDLNNPGVVKESNDLRDLKNYLVNLGESSDTGLWMIAIDDAERLETEGRVDEAEIARAAAELLSEISTKAYSDNGENLTKDIIEAHNKRVKSNDSRKAV